MSPFDLKSLPCARAQLEVNNTYNMSVDRQRNQLLAPAQMPGARPYSDVTLATWSLKSPATRPFVLQLVEADNKIKQKAPHYFSFVRGTTDEWWIPNTRDQEYGKSFHVITSSW